MLLAKEPSNLEALALGPTLGWLVFACALAFAAIVLLDLERWRRFWLRTEDPRAIAAFRIAFASVLLLNINNMWPHFEFLFTDEGLFMTDSARQSLAGGQFAGYGEGVGGEPTGFFDLAAVLRRRGPSIRCSTSSTHRAYSGRFWRSGSSPRSRCCSGSAPDSQASSAWCSRSGSCTATRSTCRAPTWCSG